MNWIAGWLTYGYVSQGWPIYSDSLKIQIIERNIAQLLYQQYYLSTVSLFSLVRFATFGCGSRGTNDLPLH